MSEPAPHTATKRHCFSRGAPLAGMPNADWIFRVGTEEKSEKSLFTVLSPADKIDAIPLQ